MTDNERKLYEERILVFINRLKSHIYEEKTELVARYCKFDPMVKFEHRLDGEYKLIQKGETWGQDWQRTWFHITGQVPVEWRGKHVCARLNLGGEGLVYSHDGTPFTAISFHSIWDDRKFSREKVDIIDTAKGGEAVDLWIEASAAQLFGVELKRDEGDQLPIMYGNYKATINAVELCLFRDDIWQLYLDCFVLNGLMKNIPVNSVRRARILRALNQAIDIFNSGSPAVDKARKILKNELKKPATASQLKTQAVGHAHIDTAWLWPVHEAIRKCARTFAAQIDLLDKYPDYVFGASQPQHYMFVKEHYPDLYAKIKEKVAEGRWELQGGMWVEADCNLISGESMVRQILHGKNFFKDEFGVDVNNLWLPDVFGYSAALPQILRKSGIDSFITQKISWNQFNRFPHHTFIWQGIDGSTVLTHFPPEDNYNSELAPSQLIRAEENFDEKAYLDEFLTLFGIGDGGGGPTDEFIEAGIRQQNLEGSPQLHFGHAQDMLQRLQEKKDLLPKWVGELYLELHRGTLTNHAYNKKMNRLLEIKMRELEMLYSLLPFDEYPTSEFETMWKKILINQFHDIIPGSSIPPVYEQSTKDYHDLLAQAENLKQQVGLRLFENDKNKLTVFNSLSHTFAGVVELPIPWFGFQVSYTDGTVLPVQLEGEKSVAYVEIPPMTALTLERKESIPSNLATIKELFVLENEKIRYEFDTNGTISCAYDKEVSRHVLQEGLHGNVFSLYEDRPLMWDAWDIEIYYENQLLEQARLMEKEWICQGEVRDGIRFTFSIGSSIIEQKIFLHRNSKKLDFETKVKWNESHKMLRVAFPTTIHAESATFDIQYGYIKRPTHRNTSWDMAKFEVCAHQYADLSDYDYGVALLNNCKYGHKIHDNVIDLNLLRSSTWPDPSADKREHEFTYSLLPHEGDHLKSNVIAEAAMLNQPPLVFNGKTKTDFSFPFALSNEQVVVECVKKAEKEDALILRLVESFGKQAKVNVRFSLAEPSVYATDLMETDIEELEKSDGCVKLDFSPFEIKTIKMKF